VLQPQAARPSRRRPGRGDPLADLLLLPDHDPRVEISDDERQFVGRLPPVRRAQHAAELGHRKQRLEHAERVLTQPEEAVARGEPRLGQGVGELVDPVVEAGMTVERARRDELRHNPLAPVGGLDVVEDRTSGPAELHAGLARRAPTWASSRAGAGCRI
jgi:hypothetical protein